LNLAKTYVCRQGEEVIGFFSVAMDSIKEEKLEESFKIMNIPAFKIARLAIDTKYQKTGIGRILLTTILAEAKKVSNIIGCRLVTVDSKRESMDFYLKHKFKHTEKSEKQIYPTLYLDLLRIE
jgi:GNAT superfamily N-acetyltransferase